MKNDFVRIDDLGLSEEELFSPRAHSDEDAEKITAPRYSYWKSVFRVFFRKKINIFVLVLLVIVVAFAFIFYSAIICHYATLGGLSTKTIKNTLSRYMTKLSSLSRPEHYWKLLPAFSLDICQKVREHNNLMYDSDIVRKSLSYIKKNI